MWPSTLTSFSNPAPTDRLNNPSHSSVETAQNTGITRLETFIGTQASAVGTILYDVRSPSSDGGGHVQSASKGGTGQTTYTKGDLLIATSSSTISKLAVGSNGQIIVADSGQAAGIKWANNTTPKVAVSGSIISLTSSTAETSIMSATIPGSVLGTNNAVKSRIYIQNINVNTTGDWLNIKALYGTSSFVTTIASIQGGTGSGIRGVIDFDLIANNVENSQRAILRTDLFPSNVNAAPLSPTTSFLGMKRYVQTTLSEDSNGPKTFGIVAQWNANSADNDLDTNGFIIEKIV